MTRRPWTPAELVTLHARYPHEPTAGLADDLGHSLSSTYQQATKLGLKKAPTVFRAMAQRPRFVEAGVAHRFPPGHVPANKGLRRPGWRAGRMAESWFKPGSYPAARWDVDAYGLGALRITTDGSLMINIGGRGRFAWAMLSRYAWWSATGKWPRRDQVVRAINGDPHDCRIENLELLTRRQNMLRNSVHNLPPAVAQVVQLRGALMRQINKRERKAA